MSDHFAITMTFDMPQLPPPPPPPPRWNQEEADWATSQNHITNWWTNYNPPDDVDQLEKDIIQAFHNHMRRERKQMKT